ncbi:MAG TPA: lysophospholipid acyltransferase family protein [Myxococcales bacterium]|jgi:1-acyl-sn-glycerol-3-phosphate acyltransferase
MAKAPVLGNDPFLRGAAQHAQVSAGTEAGRSEPETPRKAVEAKKPAKIEKRPAKKAAAAPKAKVEPKFKPEAPAKAAKPAKKPAQQKAPKPARVEPEPDAEFGEDEKDGFVEEMERESYAHAQLEEVAADEEREHLEHEHSHLEQEIPAVPHHDFPPSWFDRARETASGVADQAVQFVLANALAQRTLESVMASPVTHKVAGAAAKAVSTARPALDVALRLLPPAAHATRTAVASVVSGDAARTLVSTATEAGAALRTAARRSEPAALEVDNFGEDPTLLSRAEPLFDFLYDRYFRLQALDSECVPDGASVLVCNHSGVLPLDGPMIRTVLRRDCKRTDGRWLIEDALFHAPVIGTLLNRLGGVRACPENAERLLAKKLPLAVFPEGLLGISKPMSQRYKLQRFGRGGFVKLALRARTPIVPVAIVGAEEASPLLAKIPIGLSVGLPYLPVTPTFPFLGPLGLIPFPTKWTVSFLPPVNLKKYGPEEAENPALVAQITAEVRDAIQAELDRLVAQRQSLISG